MSKDQVLTVLLHEHSALRDEMINTVDRQYSIANWLTTTLAAIAAGLFATWDKVSDHTVFLAFCAFLGIPAIITVHALAWSHTISKIHALGKRLRVLEYNVASLIGLEQVRVSYADPTISESALPQLLLGWEHQLWRGARNLRVDLTCQIVTSAIAAAYVACVCLGIYWLASEWPIGALVKASASAVAVLGVAWIALTRHLRHVLRG